MYIEQELHASKNEALLVLNVHRRGSGKAPTAETSPVVAVLTWFLHSVCTAKSSARTPLSPVVTGSLLGHNHSTMQLHTQATNRQVPISGRYLVA